jgi:hypothetical protein
VIDLSGPRRKKGFHLSDKTLTLMISLDLSPVRTYFARLHLRRCRTCLARTRKLESSTYRILEFQRDAVNRVGPPSLLRREKFIRKLDAALESLSAGAAWKRWMRGLMERPFGLGAPSSVSLLVLLVAGATLFSVLQWRTRTVSANDLLERAGKAEIEDGSVRGSAVVRQKLLVRTRKRTFENVVYRDAKGIRQAPHGRPDVEQRELAALLALAGVNWDEPLSAVTFRAWHDRQQGALDQITATKDCCLTLRTQVQQVDITEQSFTVDANTFHPVERTVEFRKFGTVEISEISEAPLSVDEAKEIFTWESPAGNLVARRSASPVERPGRLQVDEAELQARVVLNHLNADTGEQIEITRNEKGVRVQGLVETEDRKSEINEGLRVIPFLTPRVQSFSDLRAAAGDSTESPAIPQQRTTLAQVSPLERYLMEQERSREDLSRISSEIFEYALAIGRSSRTIEMILERFPDEQDLTEAAKKARSELLARNAARLLDDLREQQRLLKEVSFDTEAGNAAGVEAGDASLVQLAQRDARMSKALISGASDQNQSAKQLAAQLDQAIAQLRSRLLRLRLGPSQ